MLGEHGVEFGLKGRLVLLIPLILGGDIGPAMILDQRVELRTVLLGIGERQFEPLGVRLGKAPICASGPDPARRAISSRQTGTSHPST